MTWLDESPDPKPNNPHFWALAQHTVARDDEASGGKELTDFLAGVVDEESLLYVAQHRVLCFMQSAMPAEALPPPVRDLIAALASTMFVDGFLLGKEFTEDATKERT